MLFVMYNPKWMNVILESFQVAKVLQVMKLTYSNVINSPRNSRLCSVVPGVHTSAMVVNLKNEIEAMH